MRNRPKPEEETPEWQRVQHCQGWQGIVPVEAGKQEPDDLSVFAALPANPG